jgi:hypothetical protein
VEVQVEPLVPNVEHVPVDDVLARLEPLRESLGVTPEPVEHHPGPVGQRVDAQQRLARHPGCSATTRSAGWMAPSSGVRVKSKYLIV